MTLAWIDGNGKVRCCSDMCDGCNKREEYGCVPVTVVRGSVRDLRERVSDLIGFTKVVEDGLWALHERTFLKECMKPVPEELELPESLLEKGEF